MAKGKKAEGDGMSGSVKRSEPIGERERDAGIHNQIMATLVRGSLAVRGPRTDWDVLRDAFAHIRSESTMTWAFGEPVVATFGTNDLLRSIARGAHKTFILWFYELDAKLATVSGDLRLSFRSEPIGPEPELVTMQKQNQQGAEDEISEILFEFGFESEWEKPLPPGHDQLLVVRGNWGPGGLGASGGDED